MKDLLKSLTALSEGNVVHKGEYGNKYGKEDVRDQYGHKVGKVDKGEKAKAEAPKKGRGRPKKDVGDTGAKFDSSALNSVFGGKKPSKAVGTVSKKHSLKEYMESVEDTKNAEAVMEGMFGDTVDHSSVAANLGKLARVIKSVQTPEQFAVAQKYARRMSGTIMKHQHDNMGFGSGLKSNLQVMRAISADLKAKAEELGVPYDPLAEAGEALTVKPIPGAAQISDPEGNPIGTADAATANIIKQAAAQGKLNLGSQQGVQEGKKSKPDFTDVDKDGDKKESWKKAEKDKQKVDESRDHEASQYTDEEVGKILAREKPGMDTNGDDFYSAVYHELIQMGLTPKAARYKLNVDEDFMGDVASAYAHFQSNPSLDEGSFDDFRQHALAEPTRNFSTAGNEPGSMAAPKGSSTKINRPVPEPTPWSRDPIAAATDRAFNFIDSLGKGTKFTKESTNMKDIQVESWTKQLNGLLTEGLTVSTSTGQQGQPNTVTVSASEGDADQLMQVLRSAGIGGFGAGEEKPEIGYGVASQGEEDFPGTGTEPQPSPDVVGDDGDMLSMLKKMAGIGGGDAEVVAIGGDEGDEEGEDYEDEEGSDETSLQPTDGGEEGSEESDDEESDEEEQTDEGNAFTGKLKQTPQGGEFKQGGKTYKDTSSIEEESDEEEEQVEEGILGTLGGAAAGMAMGGPVGAAMGAVGGQEATSGGSSLFDEGHDHVCEQCGLDEADCGCDHSQVEENFANSANDPSEEEFMKLKALLSMGNDLHKMKSSQAMGNPVRVAESEMINDWKKLSGIK